MIQRKAEDLQTWTFKPQLFEKKGNGGKKHGVLDKLKLKLNLNDGADDEHDSDYDHPAFNSDSSSSDEDYDQYENDKGKKSYVNKKRSTNSPRQKNKKRYLDDASIQPGIGEYIEQGGFSLPLSLLNYKNPMVNVENMVDAIDDDVFDDNESTQPPRKTTYSQVMNLDTLSPINRKRSSSDDEEGGDVEEPCQPITWYNIFHHSVFGEPNFCNE